MAGRYSPPPHPHPERIAGFNPLAHLLSHLESPPTTPVIFTKVDLENSATHDPEDILREIRTDGDHPFPIDRSLLKKVVEKKMGHQVDTMSFISSGTFHKAFLVALDDGREIVARIARRGMPRLKTESEARVPAIRPVATINYIRQYTDIPVPVIYYFDSNPYNRLGGEYILMSKAPGIPLHRQYQHFSTETLHKFFTNLARIVITLYSHRFPMIGSLYQHPLHPSPLSTSTNASKAPTPNYKFRVGPIISWSFFGGGRGTRTDIPRGPWSSERAYLQACVDREVQEVRREGEGRLNAHRPHLPPDEVESSSEEDMPTATSLSRMGSAVAIKGGIGPAHAHVGYGAAPHVSYGTPAPGTPGPVPMSQINSMGLSTSGRNHVRRPTNRRFHSHRGGGLRSVVNSVAPSAYPSDEEPSDSSDDEVYSYMDFRSHIRSSLLITQQEARVDSARRDMETFFKYMTETLGVDDKDPEFREFALDLHDLSTANVFVDPDDLGKITCIIDWESTCVRPLWQCAHLPSFLASDPTSAEADLFRQIISELGSQSSASDQPTCGLANGQPTKAGVVSNPSAVPNAASPASTGPNEIPPPSPITQHTIQREAHRWLKAESERTEWRRAHKVVEWDGWEEGLVASILGDVELARARAGSFHGVGVGGGGLGDGAIIHFYDND